MVRYSQLSSVLRRIGKSAAFFSYDCYDAIIDDGRSKKAFGLMMSLNNPMVIGIKYGKGTKCADA